MADSDFNLRAVIEADSSGFTDAMTNLVNATNQAADALQSRLVSGTQEAGEGLQNLRAQSEEASEGMIGSLGEIQESIMHVVEAFGLLEGAKFLKEQVSGALEFGESMQKLSLETGATTNFLQTLKFAADATGTSFEGVEMATRRLTEVYSTLRSGSGSPQLLSALSSAHIDVSQLGNIQTGFEAISHAVQEFGVQSQIARSLVVQLLGRQGLDFLPILSQFDELRQKAANLHIVLPPEMLESLERGKESLNILGAVIQADAERFLSSLAPAISETANKLTDMVAAAAKSGELDRWANIIQKDLENLPSALDQAKEGFHDFYVVVHDTATVLEDAASAMEKMEKFSGGPSGLATGSMYFPMAPTPPASPAFGAPMSAHGAAGTGQGATLSYLQGPQLPPPSAVQPPPPPPNAGDLEQTQKASDIKKAQDAALQSFQQQLQAYTEEQAMEVAVSSNTTQAKVQAAQNVYDKAVSLLGQTGSVSDAQYQKEVDTAMKAGVEELNARREYLNQLKALDATQVSGLASEQSGALQVQKAELAQELAAHQITKQQELQGEQDIVGQELSIEQSKFTQLAANEAGNAQKQAEYQQDQVEAVQKAQAQIIAIQTQALSQQEQATQQAANTMAQDMNQGLNLMEKYFETAGKQQQSVMREAFQSILKDFQDMVEKMVEKWLESSALFQTFTGGEGVGGKSGVGGGLIGGVGSVLSGAVGGPTGAGYSLLGGAIGRNPGLAGLGPSSFAPGQDIPPGAFNQSLTQAFESSVGTIESVFSTAFHGVAGVVSQIFQTGFQGSGSALMSVFRTAWSSLTGTGGSALLGAGGSAAAGAASGGISAAQIAQQIAQATAQTTLLTTANTQFAVMIAQMGVQTGLLSSIAVTSALAGSPKFLGTGAAAGAFVGQGFGTPVGDGKGGMVGIVHPGELIIPASQVDPIRRIPKASSINTPGFSGGAQSLFDGGGGTGGGEVHHHTHINFGDTHALDGDGMDEVLNRHAGKIADAVQDQWTRMGRR